MKPGYKTTEFYVTLATQLGSLIAGIQGGLPPRYAGIVVAIAAVGYQVSRGLSKIFPPKPPA